MIFSNFASPLGYWENDHDPSNENDKLNTDANTLWKAIDDGKQRSNQCVIDINKDLLGIK